MSDTIERFFIAIGIGIGVFIIVTPLLGLLHIPIHYLTYSLLLGIALILFRKKIKFTKINTQSIIVLLLFILQIAIYAYGAFQYSWLEDGDPWHHATIVKFISEEKTIFESTDMDILKYMDPYPPSYGALMSIPYQLIGDMIWTLKVFNVILIALCIPFAYLAFRKIFRDKNIGLLGATILFLTPCFLSHFIWALSLALPVFLFTIYSLERMQNNKNWMWIATIMIAALTITQPSMAVKLMIMVGLYILAKMISHKNLQKQMLTALILGIVLSFIVWWGPAIIRWGVPIQNEWYGIYSPSGKIGQGTFLEENPGIFRIKGTADREYGFTDFMIAKVPNMINNPIGLGYVLFFLVGASVIYLIIDFKNLFHADWRIISLFWVAFTFLGIHGERLPIQFIAFRFWMLFAVACSLLVAGVVSVFIRKYNLSKYAVVGLILIGLIWTSGIPKYQINTSVWPFGAGWTNIEELNEYMSLDQERIYPACYFGRDKLSAIGIDNCAWCIDEFEFSESFFNKSVDEIYTFLKQKNYEYFIVDGQCVIRNTAESVNLKITQIAADDRFNAAKKPGATVLMQLK